MSSKSISRRNFLKISGLIVVAAGLTVCGVNLAAPEDPPITLSSLSLGDKTMQKSILIAYASTCGSTAEAACEIGKILNDREFAVDIQPVNEISTLQKYDMVLVGSAIHGGKWLPEAVEFAQKNQSALEGIPVAMFCVGLGKSLAYMDSIRPLLHPVSEATFSGKLDRRGWEYGLSYLKIPIFWGRLGPTIDLRNLTEVRAWAQTLFT